PYPRHSTRYQVNAIALIRHFGSLKALLAPPFRNYGNFFHGVRPSWTRGDFGTSDSPGEVMETIAGMIVTQHAGGGKANQYFLRVFNLDHGTAFATDFYRVPINLP